MKHSSYYRKMRLFTYAVGALMVAVMATACGNKNEGGGQVVAVTPGGVSGTCIGCPAATTLLASGTGRSYSYGYGPVSGELSLQFYGDTATLANYGGAQYAGSYQGSVVADGVFRNREARVAASAWAGCNLPVGDYPITTTQPGQWRSQSFSTIGMSSTSGPVALTIRMHKSFVQAAVPALVDYAGAQFPFHLVTEMEITSSAGGTCVYLIDGRY